MAKYFVIEFSEEIVKLSVKDENGKIFTRDTAVRDIEMLVLSNLLRYARIMSRNMDEGFRITDVINQVKKAGEKEEKLIKVTTEDIAFLNKGYETATGSKEINEWFDICQNLLLQIHKPISEDDFEKPKEKL